MWQQICWLGRVPWPVRVNSPHHQMVPTGTDIVVLLPLLLLLPQDEDFFHKIPEPTEDELDMLDLAFGLTET